MNQEQIIEAFQKISQLAQDISEVGLTLAKAVTESGAEVKPAPPQEVESRGFKASKKLVASDIMRDNVANLIDEEIVHFRNELSTSLREYFIRLGYGPAVGTKTLEFISNFK